VERILVAQSAHEVGGKDDIVNYDLFIMDKDGGNLKLVHADPNANDYDPVVLAPRVLPYPEYGINEKVLAGLKNQDTTGFFFDANVYSRQDDGQPKDADIQGKIKYLRVLAAVPTPAHCGPCGQEMGHTAFERQRVLGYADVRSDGSFSIEVPANTPMHVQTLDEDGLMLVNQLQWIDVMPGEQRICTGCHGIREKDQDIRHFTIDNLNAVHFNASDNDVRNYMASFANAQKVTAHPAARTDIVDFHALHPDSSAAKGVTIQGIFDARCVSCHGSADAEAKGGGLSLEFDPADTARTHHGSTNVYETLTAGAHYRTAAATGDRDAKLDYATDNGARQSPLAWVLFNRQLGRKNENLFRVPAFDHTTLWEKDSANHIDLFSKANTDLRTLVEWMDMGVQFVNTVPRK
jgi:mono/diheme cytochrome c family protein